jgi:hypothetical protein
VVWWGGVEEEVGVLREGGEGEREGEVLCDVM